MREDLELGLAREKPRPVVANIPDTGLTERLDESRLSAR
jgi:hypothetical protein